MRLGLVGPLDAGKLRMPWIKKVVMRGLWGSFCKDYRGGGVGFLGVWGLGLGFGNKGA